MSRSSVSQSCHSGRNSRFTRERTSVSRSCHSGGNSNLPGAEPVRRTGEALRAPFAVALMPKFLCRMTSLGNSTMLRQVPRSIDIEELCFPILSFCKKLTFYKREDFCFPILSFWKKLKSSESRSQFEAQAKHCASYPLWR